MYLLDKTLIPGDQVSNAAANLDTTTGWVINLTFNSAGYSTWATYTTNNTGKLTAFTLDGLVLSNPGIRNAITTTVTQVSGNFTQATATSLANSLKFGALPLHFEPAESQAVSAQLGTQYLQAGLIAGGIGLLLVVVYCLRHGRGGRSDRGHRHHRRLVRHLLRTTQGRGPRGSQLPLRGAPRVGAG